MRNKINTNTKKVMVTGGAGFIGSHLAEELVLRGYYTVVLDNLSSGSSDNIQHLKEKANFHFINGSINNTNMLAEASLGIDFIFHHAALTSVPQSVEDFYSYHMVNLTGTLNVLEAAKRNDVKKVIFASSSSVYGNNPLSPKTEDMPPTPQSPYAVTKLSAEYYCEVYKLVFGLSTICLRYFNVYGPRQNANSPYSAVIPKFINAIEQNKQPVIFGDGTQTRDFVFVKDIVNANILAAESNSTGIYNIGSGQELTLNCLLSSIVKQMNKENIKPIYQKERIGDIKHSLANINKAKIFGYTPTYSLEQGLMEVIKSANSIVN